MQASIEEVEDVSYNAPAALPLPSAGPVLMPVECDGEDASCSSRTGAVADISRAISLEEPMSMADSSDAHPPVAEASGSRKRPAEGDSTGMRKRCNTTNIDRYLNVWRLDEGNREPPIYHLVRDENLMNGEDGMNGNVVRTSHLSDWYSFVKASEVREDLPPNGIWVRSPSIELLLNEYRGWSRAQLRVISTAHHCSYTSASTKQEIIHNLVINHKCTVKCRQVLYGFKLCANERHDNKRPRRATSSAQAGNRGGESIRFVTPIIAEPSFPTVRSDGSHFPFICPEDRRLQIIREFQEYFRDEKWITQPCAVCGQGKYAKDMQDVPVSSISLPLLRNDDIDCDLWPQSYNFAAYQRAFLEPRALSDRNNPCRMQICNACKGYLDRKSQPPEAIANQQYYAHERLPQRVREAFENATIHELQLASACRATKISFVYSQDRAGHTVPQRYSKGNVAIIPQDVAAVERVLPPSPDDKDYMICVLFVGGCKKPTKDDLKDLHPVLVNKERVEIMIRFLIENNPFYKEEGVSFSKENLDALCPAESFRDGVGISTAVEICHVPDRESAAQAPNAGYTDRIIDIAPPADDLLMEVVGYASASQGAVVDSSMKAEALDHCMNNGQCLQITAGNELFPDRDLRMMTFLFPHLDPYGIGGFHNPTRTGKQVLSFERQLKNLLLRFQSPFAKDPNFAYICWNIIQKLEASRSMSFRVRDNQYKDLCNELIEAQDLLEVMRAKWTANHDAEPTTTQEKRAVALLNKLRVVSKEVRGSNGQKLKLRNEIRALLKVHGCPALFLTINPADVHHKLVHILAGGDPASFRQLTAFQRAKQVAENPKAAALFFDNMIHAFIKIILRHGDPQPGLFGHSAAYYGTVEAQGRGTLHCHMLIWLKGSLSPQALRDKLQTDEAFRLLMFSWLESIIKCELHDMTSVLRCRPGERIVKPANGHADDIRTSDAPQVPEDLTEDERENFMTNFREFVKEMAIECNWHDHRDTCWKHLKPGQPRDDAHCRMRMDGKTLALTEVDPETWSIRLRRLHPWINNFNDVIIFLLKCNMDIKFIGSGKAAKALVYYVTDYITKAALPFHLGLDALCYAIRQNTKKYANNHDVDETSKHRSLIIKVVNAMMARQEISHQQVMSYLLGTGDHYTNHTFRSLYWGELDRYITAQERASGGSSHYIAFVDDHEQFLATEHDVEELLNASSARDDMHDNFSSDEEATESDVGEDDGYLTKPTGLEQVPLRIDNGKVNISSLLYDYRYRSIRPAFQNLSVWEHVAWVEKVTKTSEERRLRKNPKSQYQTASERVSFSSSQHPQFDTHVSRLRKVPVVPVYLGPAIPRADRGGEQYTRYCRTMLLLFKPWRALSDLKTSDETWEDAFNNYTFSTETSAVIKNIHVERECQDARDDHENARRRGEAEALLSGDNDSYSRDPLLSAEIDAAFIPDQDVRQVYVDVESTTDGVFSHVASPRGARQDAKVEESLRILQKTGLLDTANETTFVDSQTSSMPRFTVSPDDVSTHQKTMDVLKKNKRPRPRNTNPCADGDFGHAGTIPPTVSLASIADTRATNGHSSVDDHQTELHSPEKLLEDIIIEKNISGNEEQERAVRIIAEHYIRQDAKQLLMHISGIGGTGKTHVVRTIVEFFRRCQALDQILLSAPTGIAAVLIGGYTIHALGYLPIYKNKNRSEELAQIWKGVKYLIVDEVSMVSPNMLSDLSDRIAEGKAGEPGAADKPFGGINVIFTGDFGQLKPVRATSLLAHKWVTAFEANQAQSTKGQKELQGICLWRQVTTVVELTKNWRQDGDHEYAALINRIRLGKGTNYSRGGVRSDYEILSRRTLNVIKSRNPHSIKDFKNAPIIVSTRKMRDAMNMKIAHAKASELRQTMKTYAARDKQNGIHLKGDTAMRVRALRPHLTEDSYGHLPLFVGMRVMITENADVLHGIANGAEGYVEHVVPATDREGTEYAACAYVRVPGSGFKIDNLDVDIVPVFPVSTSFTYITSDGGSHTIRREQLPLLPAYAYTDYKSQGRSLTRAIVDLTDCGSLQSVYVMLSRVRTLEGLAVLRWFPPSKIDQGLTHEFRHEFERLSYLQDQTKRRYLDSRSSTTLSCPTAARRVLIPAPPSRAPEIPC